MSICREVNYSKYNQLKYMHNNIFYGGDDDAEFKNIFKIDYNKKKPISVPFELYSIIELDYALETSQVIYMQIKDYIKYNAKDIF